MKLKDVLEGIPVVSLGGAAAGEISGIAYNSKAVQPGFLFAALQGGPRRHGFRGRSGGERRRGRPVRLAQTAGREDGLDPGRRRPRSPGPRPRRTSTATRPTA